MYLARETMSLKSLHATAARGFEEPSIAVSMTPMIACSQVNVALM